MYVVTDPGDRHDLVPPRVPALGEAVTQQDERSFARLRDVELDAVGGRLPVADLDRHVGADVRRRARGGSRSSDSATISLHVSDGAFHSRSKTGSATSVKP